MQSDPIGLAAGANTYNYVGVDGYIEGYLLNNSGRTVHTSLFNIKFFKNWKKTGPGPMTFTPYLRPIPFTNSTIKYYNLK